MTELRHTQFHITAAGDTTHKLYTFFAWCDIGLFTILAAIYTILMNNGAAVVFWGTGMWTGYFLALLGAIPGIFLLLYLHNWAIDIRNGEIVRTNAFGMKKILGNVSEITECADHDHQFTIMKADQILFSFSFLNGGDTLALYRQLFGHLPEKPSVKEK
ncbi:MAG: hypothetical protein EOM64_10260 [Erysipelotrichia bacterium]|nr:hypothetical protein [Erysipelotrichia bacterium]